MPFTVTPGTDTVDAISHPFSNPDVVTLESDGRLPDGLSKSPIVYFVINAGANDLQLSLTSGGSAVSINDDGSGTHNLRADPARFWTDVVTF